MDPQNPAKRNRSTRARQRQHENSPSARRRHMQQPSGGGVSARRRDEEAAEARQASEQTPDSTNTTNSAPLRDRLQSGATATMTAVTERVRRVSQRSLFSRSARDPLARPTTWIVEPTLSERLHNWLADIMPFSWRERARRRGFWRRRVLPIVVVFACLAVGLSVGVFALKTTGHAAAALLANSTAAQPTAGGSVMISPLNNTSTTPTPVAEQYDVGVWVSDTLPQGGSVTVYARVSNNTLPEPGVKVYFNAVTPRGTIALGPFTTDAYGLAATTLNYGNVGPQQPIYLTATTSISGKTYSGEYTFVTFG